MRVLLQEYKMKIIPLLFSISITWWVLESLIGETAPELLLIVFILHSIVFIGLIQAGKSRLRLFLFLAGTVIYFILIFFIIRSAQGSGNNGYLMWIAFLQPDNTGILIEEYWIATIFLVSYVFSAIVFYFSCIWDRIGILFLTGCIPLLLHTAKTKAGITLPFVLFVSLFFCLYIGKNRKLTEMNDAGSYSKKGWYLGAVLIFVTIAMGVAFSLPKPLISPKLAELDSVVYDIIRPLINPGSGEEIERREIYPLIHNSEGSSIDRALAPTGDRVLFSVYAYSPLYLRVQARDRYYKNTWLTTDGELTKGYPISDYKNRRLQLTALMQILRRLDEGYLRELGFDNPDEIRSIPFTVVSDEMATIYFNMVQTDYYPTVPGVYTFRSEMQDSEPLMNGLGFCYLPGSKPFFHEEYILNYYPAPSPEQIILLRQMNKEIRQNISDRRMDIFRQEGIGDSKQEEAYIMSILFDSDIEMSIAYRYFTDLPNDLPDRIHELSASITAGETNDYGKAKAIENYFHTAGFRYDTTPPRLPNGKDINDYFLFESKRGFCVHFASAMVILARACGLPARYVEGFVADEYEPNTGRYWVRASDAHAFPEIYISGYGWMVFEPTVSSTDEDGFFAFFRQIGEWIKSTASQFIQIIRNSPPAVKLLFVPFILFAVLYIMWFFINLRYHSWMKRTMKVDTNLALKRIFIRIISLMKKVKVFMNLSDTPSTFAARVLNEKGIDINSLAETYNRAKYGGYKLTRDELLDAMKIYNKVVSGIKAHVGKPAAWLIR